MSGWNSPVTAVTLTYSSADAPVFVAGTSADLTGTVSVGMRLRVSQSTGGTKYFIVVAINNSTVTLYGGTDYTLNNEAISSPVFSSEKAPHGFPLNPAKWTQLVTDNQDRTQASPSNNTWYNLGGISIDIPIGVWEVEYFGVLDTNIEPGGSIDAYMTLSTANNTESDPTMTGAIYSSGVPTSSSVYYELIIPVTRRRVIALTSKTPYYLNEKTTTSAENLHVLGNWGVTVISAKCAYL